MRIILLIAAIFISGTLTAQKYQQRGDAYYSIRQYAKAIPDYERCLRKNADQNDVRLKLADCYRKTIQLKRAEENYELYLSFNSQNDSVRIVYAEILKRQGKYSEAKEQYLKLSEKNPDKSRYALYCDSALSYQSAKTFYQIENLTHINSFYSEIAPVVYGKGILFSSNREEVIIRKKSGNTNLPLYDLLYAEGKDVLRPEHVSNFSIEINTIHHECCATFTKDYKKIFFTRSIDKPYSNDPGSKNPLKMYSASKEGETWGELHTFIFNDTTRSYGHPSVEGSEEMFFFASDMEGGYGGTDLYVCFNIEDKWTNPINLGPEVNSIYNEMYPFFHEDGTLYFSSDRPEGLGGYDIYSATENDEGEYGNILNMGMPVNSSYDDLSIYWRSDKRSGYFSSNRPEGKGEEDIYLIYSLEQQGE